MKQAQFAYTFCFPHHFVVCLLCILKWGIRLIEYLCYLSVNNWHRWHIFLRKNSHTQNRE